MLLEDTPELPSVFYARFEFDGIIKQEILQQAVDKALQRNVLLNARLELSRGVPHWRLRSEVSVEVRECAFEAWECLPWSEGIDLRVESGMRVSFVRGGNKSLIWLQFHHACCDGHGARRFIVDLLTFYAQIMNEDTIPRLNELDQKLLASRGQIHIRPTEWSKESEPTTWQKLVNAKDFLFRHPLPVPEEQKPRISFSAKGPSNTRWHHVTLSRQQTVDSWENARNRGHTLNDVLLGTLFHRLARWNVVAGAGNERSWLRVTVPVNFRRMSQKRLPAANHMGLAFLNRRIGDCLNQRNTIEQISDEMSYVKQSGVARDFVNVLGGVVRFPWLCRLLSRNISCLSTAILTNMDDPMRRARRHFPSDAGRMVVGNLRLLTIHAVPPIRKGTRLGFGVTLHGSQLSLAVLGDASVLTSESIGGYLSDYATSILNVASMTEQILEAA